MALLLNLIFALAFAGSVGGAVHLWRAHLDSTRRDGMQALAARRGWALTVTGERLGRAGTLRLVPRGGHPWMAEARPAEGRRGGPVTLYEAEEPAWTEGTLVLIACAPEGPRDAQPSAEPLPRPREAALRDLLGEDVARLAGPLEQVPAPEGVTALASGDPSRRLELEDLARVMSAFAPVARGTRGRPVLILSPEGMRLRLRRALARPEQMERFLDLAFAISRLIGP
ncbi:hypothetical protein Rumeso_02169 [Rubellimicrobium mesophilum DSM 19309]|uniref:Uncharacterized protein n=1 Tax=Rubellimicrobium mesophilum DSM 19309 TaxID=442562 RepID=A0A017HPJ8_9RHOB|nr:hypothetical protein [Rubellimicrobium mesophilum]EYD76245.1 hypothetical protein Rumeso_02169 [Rubellimicrobium mesophilum DSM 19309]